MRRAVTLAFFNQKGGVGKTTGAVNVAGALAATGAKVLLVDLDAQQSAAMTSGVQATGPNLFHALMNPGAVPFPAYETGGAFHCAPGDTQSDENPIRAYCAANPFELRHQLDALDEYDFKVLDLPNHRGPAVQMGLLAADVAVLVVKAEPLSLPGLAEARATILDARQGGNSQLRVRALLNDYTGGKVANEVVSDVRAQFQKSTFESLIPRSKLLAEALLYSACGGAVVDYAPRNNPARKAFEALALEIKNQFGP